jgi:HEAT repeat protein
MNEAEPVKDEAQQVDEGWADLAHAPVAPVRHLLVTLGKALRAYQLYDENNPVRHRFIQTLRQAFLTLWTDAERLTVLVEEDRILLGGESVYRSEDRNDSLAFLFYKDGIREITFLPGLETEELERFLSVLQKARRLTPEGDDLLTVLWDEELQYFQYQYVDLLAEGVHVPDPGEGAEEELLQQVLEGELAVEEEEEEEEEGEQPQTVRQDEFNPTLYALDAHEMEQIRSELHKETYRDLRGDVLSALFDRLEEPDRPDRQMEILGILETLLPTFLSRGRLTAGTRLLDELRQLESKPGVFDEPRLARARGILDSISSPEAIDELIQALYEGSIRASPEQLSAFLGFLRAGAIPPLLRAAETVEHKALQTVLRSAVRGIAERNRSAVVRLLTAPDPVVAAGAARLAGDVQIAEAGPALAGLLAHSDPSVRLAAVEAAQSLKASTVAGALAHTLDDPEREVRIAAARALGDLRYEPAAKQLEDAVATARIRDADISEKVALFEAYALVAGEGGVKRLDKILSSKGFLGRREPSEIRAAAALGLGRIPGEVAHAALMKAHKDPDPVVRSAVNRALRSED